MRYLVTGGAGFIGSHLAEVLLKRNNHVTILDDFSTGRMENISHLEKNENFQIVRGSIQDEELVDKLAEKVDSVFHLAAAVGVELIIKKPFESLTTNIKGTEVVLEASCRYNRKLLITSTSEIYGKNANGPLKEGDDRILGSPLKSRWSYSTSKAVDEILSYIYFKVRGLPTIIVRLFNTVGPRQSGTYGMVVPRFIRQALKEEPITIYGDGRQSRCFLHVRDAVQAMIKLMEKEEAVGEVFNLGSQEEVSIENLAKKIIEITKSKSGLVYIPYDEAYEEGFEDMPRRVPDINKIHKLINFKPTKNLEGIIEDVIRYHKKNLS
ncbi:MAG: GDP-mannose 4,6-dehydratase [Candidatus Omnitrophica bacterium]|nr:GDP-mannose 4,6-dehydratase [Candidatus Omnitrophota bacterium]